VVRARSGARLLEAAPGCQRSSGRLPRSARQAAGAAAPVCQVEASGCQQCLQRSASRGVSVSIVGSALALGRGAEGSLQRCWQVENKAVDRAA
jgi:hypothetical protein